MALRVLLIEDDPSTADGIALMLRAESFACDVAGLGAEGLEKLEQHAYDVILLDLLLPDLTGYEVLHQLRAAQIATPVIILSGLGELDDRVTGLDSGADDYLIKPVERRELVARIGALVRRSMGQISGLAGGQATDETPLLAKKGAASPWSFDMSYVPPDGPAALEAPDGGRIGRKVIMLPAPGALSCSATRKAAAASRPRQCTSSPDCSPAAGASRASISTCASGRSAVISTTGAPSPRRRVLRCRCPSTWRSKPAAATPTRSMR